MFTQAVTFSSLAVLISGHVLINNPVPYGASSLDLLPLRSDGSDFPCKQRQGVYDVDGASNVYAQGSTQQLSFIGTTVYGGGSCQISVTQDLQPNADSVWKVIKSIEGGCPARNVTGNLEGDLMDPTPDTYDFTIPADLPAGDYSLAWTWFNKIGNREMYMNCAPVTITGTEGDATMLESLPDMFVANVNECSTTEGTDVVFPQPGDDISRENVATDVFAAPVGACATGTAQMPPVNQEPVMPPMPTETPVSTPVNIPTVAPTPVQSTPAAPATPTAGPVEGVPADVLTGPCCTEGMWNCIDGSSFQRCASGAWSAAQPVSEGTMCTKGQSLDFHMLPIAPRGAFMQRRRRSVV